MNRADIEGFEATLKLPRPVAEARVAGMKSGFEEYIAMRRGIRFLILFTIRSELPTNEILEFAHMATRPELLRDPELGQKEMDRLADVHQHDGLGPIFAHAADAFTVGIEGKGNQLEQFLWDTPAVQIQIALAMFDLLTLESTHTIGRTLLEIREHIAKAATMLGESAPSLETV